MTCRSFTLVLSIIPLFHLFPSYTHGSSLASNATQSNSSHTASNAMGLEPALPVKATPIFSSQRHTHKPRSAEEPGSSGLGENRNYAFRSESTEHHIEVAVGGMGAGLPTMSHRKPQLDIEDTEETKGPKSPAPHWHSDGLQPDGSVLDPHSRSPSLFLSDPDDSNPIIKVRFSEPDQHHQTEIPPQEVAGGDPTSWSSFYDYLSPDYSTTESYASDDQSKMENENIQLVMKVGLTKSLPGDGASGVHDTVGPQGAVGNSRCLLGFVHRNGTCHSPCDVYTSYCFNGGQCYVVDGIGAFCRCNIQDYMWNKGMRCESVITDFQLMVVVVSGISVTLLILFMVIVFFTKRLHLLTLENRQLRKHSKSRPHSEQLNDNFSLSTVAEGSEINVRNECDSPSVLPPALAYDNFCQNDSAKPEEPVKTPVKEHESLNIQNSLTPKHENSTITTEDPEESGVTIDLELLLPNEAKTHPETSPPLHYNVFLCKLPKSPKISPGHSREGKCLQKIRPRRGSEPGYSPMSSRTPNPRLGKACTP